MEERQLFLRLKTTASIVSKQSSQVGHSIQISLIKMDAHFAKVLKDSSHPNWRIRDKMERTILHTTTENKKNDFFVVNFTS